MAGLSEAFLRLPFQPAFTAEELRSRRMKIADLKVICDEWNIPYPTRAAGRKNSYVDTIINHDNNVDPAFIAVFGIRNIPLPPYNKVMLKQLTNNQLSVIQSRFYVPVDPATPHHRRAVINAILAHPYSRFNFRDPNNVHVLEAHDGADRDGKEPDYDTDTEPIADIVLPETLSLSLSSILLNPDGSRSGSGSGNNVSFDLSADTAENNEMMVQANRLHNLLPPGHSQSLDNLFPSIPSITTDSTSTTLSGTGTSTTTTTPTATITHSDDNDDDKTPDIPDYTPSPTPPLQYFSGTHNSNGGGPPDDDDNDSSDDDIDIPYANNSNSNNSNSSNSNTGIANVNQLINGLNDFKDFNKLKVTITGSPDENLPNKITDIQLHQQVTNCSWTSIHKYLVTKGLSGQARARFRDEARYNYNNVDEYDKLITFLFTNFNGDYFADKLSKELEQLQQAPNERLIHYYQKYIGKVKEYSHIIRMIRRYKVNTNTLVREKSTGDIYVAFINSLYTIARDKIRTTIEMNGMVKDVMQIRRAVEMADTLIHEGLGVKGTFNGNGNISSSSRNKRDKNTRNRNGINNRGRGRGRIRSRTRSDTFQNISNKTSTYNNNGNYQSDTYRDRSRSRSRSRGNNRMRGRGRGNNKFNRNNYNNNSNNNNRKSVQCFKCNGFGHYANKCPQLI